MCVYVYHRCRPPDSRGGGKETETLPSLVQLDWGGEQPSSASVGYVEEG